jgi:hypothetical protein
MIMDPIRLVVVEDDEDALRRVDNVFGDDGCNVEIPTLRLDRDLSIHFTGGPDEAEEVVNRICGGIMATNGPMILSLDLDLGLSEKRAEVRRQTEQVLGMEIPGSIERQVDGLLIAATAIKQKEIKPLLIVLATGHGQQYDLIFLLNEFARVQQRSNDVQIVAGNYLSVTNVPDPNYVNNIFKKAEFDFNRHFGDPVDKVFNILDESKDEHDEHYWIDHSTERETVRLITTLLGLKEEDVRTKIWQTWKTNGDSVRETLKRMGIRNELSASAAWFYALAAYLRSGDSRDWQGIFHVQDINDDALPSCYLNPPQMKDTLRRTIRAYYEMCAALFAAKVDAQEVSRSPLTKVTVSKSGGLRMLLDFDCGLESATRQSLYRKIGNWRNESLEWEREETVKGTRTTSQAVWRFWQATSLGDTSLDAYDDNHDDSGVFGSKELWRINIIRRSDGRTEVVFNGC